jgi:hypothetical protein
MMHGHMNVKFDRSLSSESHNDKCVCGQMDRHNKAMGTFHIYTNMPSNILHLNVKRWTE